MDQQQADEKKQKNIKKEIFEWIKSIVIAVALYFLVTALVFQVIYVDGYSMTDTLLDGERMFVTKYQYLFSDPERFDVVICHYPDRGRTNFVKRIVGIPGDTLRIADGVLYVNGEAVEEDYINYPPIYDMQEQVVPEGYYFVMGDNRASSNDSRNPAIGPLARDQIVGKVRATIWPLSQWRSIH